MEKGIDYSHRCIVGVGAWKASNGMVVLVTASEAAAYAVNRTIGMYEAVRGSALIKEAQSI